VLVATTHLKAKISQQNEDLRTGQVKQMLALIADAADSWGECAIIFAADHNADAYDVTEKGVVINATCVPAVAKAERPRLRCAYPLPTSDADMFTTWKKRGQYEAKHTIDYIWYSKDPSMLRCLERLAGVPAAEMAPARLPGFRYPSDHLSLWARFELVRSAPHQLPTRTVSHDSLVSGGQADLMMHRTLSAPTSESAKPRKAGDVPLSRVAKFVTCFKISHVYISELCRAFLLCHSL
jgi:hypothetical protein